MKIEVELLKIDQDTDKARACAVALLSALPQDEAELAIAEWRAVQHGARRGGGGAARGGYP